MLCPNGLTAEHPGALGQLDVKPGGHALSLLLMSLSAFFLSWLHDREPRERALVWLGFLAGAFWWSVMLLRELIEHYSGDPLLPAMVIAWALTVVLATSLRGALSWPRLGWMVVGVAGLWGRECRSSAMASSWLAGHGWSGWLAFSRAFDFG